MTKKHFERAAEIVKMWDAPVERAGLAEAFILLFRAYNDRFDTTRFLQACGLVEQPAKKGR